MFWKTVLKLWLTVSFVVGKQQDKDSDDAVIDDKTLNKWLDTVPDQKLPPIPPMAGLLFPEIGGDYSLEIPKYHLYRTYKCYSCKKCHLRAGRLPDIEDNCNECVTMSHGSEPPDRICNRASHSVCRDNEDARCCQGDLCNFGLRIGCIRTQSYSVFILTTTGILRYFTNFL
ncbi:hypothetical protein PHET_01218 [Paragonimus heterotremus]|uniref:Uncharacterized protein n=1 Tax=Paragonimus heterotremus TaxID=100268 RepID=A0A8J4STR6_9TREM|nr:hypothetical protein PHET_01218 [Paragonimus heterotremus]